MQKSLLISLLVGNFLVLSFSEAKGVTLTHTTTVSSINTGESVELRIPQYNPAAHSRQPLKAIFIEAISAIEGNYSLQNTKTHGSINYGSHFSNVGAELLVSEPSSILLNPIILNELNKGILTPGNTFSTTLNGNDTRSKNVAKDFFNLYTGTDTVAFVTEAMSIINVSKSRIRFFENAEIQASLTLNVTYKFENSPSSVEIPEPNLRILGFAAVVGLGVILLKPAK